MILKVGALLGKLFLVSGTGVTKTDEVGSGDSSLIETDFWSFLAIVMNNAGWFQCEDGDLGIRH
jgi:hypothetical protein